MSVPFLKNFLGIRCTDYELLRVPYPRLELTVHVTFKTVEAGTLIGSLIFGPVKALVDGESPLQTALIYGAKGALVGLAIGPVLSAIRLMKLNKVQVYDRCYRLRFNRSMLNLDRAALFGAVVGVGVGGPAGFVIGVDLAMISGMFSYFAFAKNKKNLMTVL
ncbi:unnamed protein product [Soboliphyme baturini]|uniref:Membrane transporter protein n=1 Tax=Soboliphyme baturini TaxID=241478 RepID=A0A183IHL7_9BILA|nr:unnamed protein product [Soboliphyme baturini]